MAYPPTSPLRRENIARAQSWKEKKDGTLHVYLESAFGLATEDIDYKADPFVSVEAGKRKAKTRVIKNTLEPVWKQELSLKGKIDDFVAAGVRLLVLDWDARGSPDVLDELKIKLDEIQLRSGERVEYVDHKLSRQGFMSFSIWWVKAKESAADTEARDPIFGSRALRVAVPVLLPSKFDYVKACYQRFDPDRDDDAPMDKPSKDIIPRSARVFAPAAFVKTRR